jgi:hypothetical protein
MRLFNDTAKENKYKAHGILGLKGNQTGVSLWKKLLSRLM